METESESCIVIWEHMTRSFDSTASSLSPEVQWPFGNLAQQEKRDLYNLETVVLVFLGPFT